MDRRVRKTREALYSAFISLVAEKGYEPLTVQEIIDAADVGRTTFYAHFRTKEDLLGFGFERLRDELGDLFESDQGDSWAFVEPLLNHARSHSGLFRALTEGGGREVAERQFLRVVEDLVALALDAPNKRSLEVTMLVGALLAGIQSWIESGGRKGGDATISRTIRAMGASMMDA